MSILWWVQIAADVILLAALLVLILKLKGKGPGLGSGSGPDLDHFVKEAGGLSREFDRLLAEKRELIRTTLVSLDNRIAELKAMAADFEKIRPQAEQPARQNPHLSKAPSPAEALSEANTTEGMEHFRRQVRSLAQKGRNPAQIADATGRPRGEVELVLNLKK